PRLRSLQRQVVACRRVRRQCERRQDEQGGEDGAVCGCEHVAPFVLSVSEHGETVQRDVGRGEGAASLIRRGRSVRCAAVFRRELGRTRLLACCSVVGERPRRRRALAVPARSRTGLNYGRTCSRTPGATESRKRSAERYTTRARRARARPQRPSRLLGSKRLVKRIWSGRPARVRSSGQTLLRRWW